VEVLSKDKLTYFKKGEIKDPRFWRRFGGQPDFHDKTILDVGSGHGSLCIYIARAGAKKVIGIDLNKKLIDFAKENLKRNYPELREVVEFQCCDLNEYPENEYFDFIVSKNTFEHILELESMLKSMKRCLKGGGKIYAGFAPLWKSPFGDHGRTFGVKFPWGHLLFNMKSCENLGLNKRSFSNYSKLFNDSGFEIKYFKPNHNEGIASKLFSQLRKIPFLREYCTHSLYIIMHKTK
jgi:SAM-dependent methyltransferase